MPSNKKQLNRSHRAFVGQLSKLPLLNKVHFGDRTAKNAVAERLNLEVFSLGHKLDGLQLRHFRKSGEIGKLLRACGSRFNAIAKNVLKSKIGHPVETVSIMTDWFAFDPSAYALTYELENDAGYIVVLATPMLCGVYSNNMKFNTVEDIATFVDSILIHELAHCVGSMKHDGEFKKVFNRICELEGVEPSV